MNQASMPQWHTTAILHHNKDLLIDEPPLRRVFISYARKDAARLASELQAGLRPDHDVWLDTARLQGGASWTAEIEQEIDRCDVLLALMTPGSYVSDVCRAEQLRALSSGEA